MINLTNRIQKIFDKLKTENKKAFISFSVGGYPDEESSLEIAKAIADSGSHIHEISKLLFSSGYPPTEKLIKAFLFPAFNLSKIF